MTFWMSGFHLLVVLATLLLQPFSDVGPLDFMSHANLWLGPLQGLVGIALPTSSRRSSTRMMGPPIDPEYWRRQIQSAPARWPRRSRSPAGEGEMMPKYYLITLKNARAYEARDVLCNGLPLAGLHMLVGPGRLQFIALPAVQSNAQTFIGGFKSMSGIDAEFDISDPAIPGRHCTLRGRVISAITQPGGAVPANSETITIAYSKVEYKL